MTAAPPTSTGRAAPRRPTSVAEAVHDTLIAPARQPGPVTPAERNADAAVRGGPGRDGRPARRRPRRHRLRAQHDPADLRLRAHPGQGLGSGRRGRRHPARPRRQRAAVGASPPRPSGATVRWADFDPATGELDAERGRPACSSRAHPAGRGHRRLQPDRHPARPARDRRARCTPSGALLYVDGVHLHRARRGRRRRRSGADFFACSPYKFLGPALRRPRRPTRGARAARPGQAAARRPTRCRSGSSSGTLPYELMAGTTAAVDFLADLATGAGGRRSRRRAARRRRWPRSRQHEDAAAGPARGRAAQLPGVTLYSRAARRTPTAAGHVRAATTRSRVRHFLAERGVNAPAGSFYALRGVAPARPRRRPAASGSAWRRTPTTTTSTGCWRAWRRSSVGDQHPGRAPRAEHERVDDRTGEHVGPPDRQRHLVRRSRS